MIQYTIEYNRQYHAMIYNIHEKHTMRTKLYNEQYATMHNGYNVIQYQIEYNT